MCRHPPIAAVFAESFKTSFSESLFVPPKMAAAVGPGLGVEELSLLEKSLGLKKGNKYSSHGERKVKALGKKRGRREAGTGAGKGWRVARPWTTLLTFKGC